MRFWTAQICMWPIGMSLLPWAVCHAQIIIAPSPASAEIRPIGTVSPADATVIDAAGNSVAISAKSSFQTLSEGYTVRALDHTAPVRLVRGGQLLVCQGTRVHLADSADASLLFGLDRGSMEVKTQAQAGDVILTPDLRFTASESAPLDLQMRVTNAGDTCVDNRGRRAPTLKISSAFGNETYELKPGQHVTFEHGSLQEVVDKESVPCGCPVDELKRGSLADAMIAGGAGGKPMTPAQRSAAEHPFPAAASDGLATPSPAPPQATGETHVQVGATLAYDSNAPAHPAAATPEPSPTAPIAPVATIPNTRPVAPPQPHTGGPFKAIGRFFKRLFTR